MAADKRERESESDSDSSSDFGPAPVEGAEVPEDGGDNAGQGRKKKKRRADIPHKEVLLASLPSETLYEKSYMHKDVVTQVIVAMPSGFVVTCSIDGALKFWKKAPMEIIHVKTYRPHLGAFTATLCHDGTWLATKAHSADRIVKVFDVMNFDMINMIQLSFASGPFEFIHSTGANACLAIAEAMNPVVHTFDPQGTDELAVHKLRHGSRIDLMRFNAPARTTVTIDSNGMINYSTNDTFEPPEQGTVVSFGLLMETDLFQLAKKRVRATSLEFSKSGELFAIMGSDNFVYVFRFATGKLFRVYDQTAAHFVSLQKAEYPSFHLEPLDFGKRIATEKEVTAARESGTGLPVASNVIFDDSGHFILFSTLLGVLVLNLRTNRIERVLGKLENTERFLNISLFQGKAEATQQLQQQLGEKTVEQAKREDPTLFATSWKRGRFYLLTRREPEDVDGDDANAVGRDVFNEKPSEEDIALLSTTKVATSSTAVLRTTYGDIHIHLFGEHCPKTVENFVGHAKSGYYDNLTFHRVIKGFMIQTGCPLGDGTGGESIWGGSMDDEFHESLRHDRAYTVSMANSGPNTNGSQFFITTGATPWLDDKHTIFGRVKKGMDVVQAIEKVKTVEKGAFKNRPIEPIRVVNVEIQ